MSAFSSVLTMTPTPLVLLGPGGDFADRLNVKGTALTRVRGRASAHAATADGDNPGAPGYERPAGHDADDAAPASTPAGDVRRAADTFDTSGDPAAAQTYGPDGQLREPARVSVLSAAAAWLEMQSFTVSDLAHDHEQHRRTVLAAIQSSATAATPLAPVSAAPPAPAVRPQVTVARMAARLIDAVLPSAFQLSPGALPGDAGSLQAPLQTPLQPSAESSSAGSFPSRLLTQSASHEPDPQTAPHPQPHPRDASDARLFPDDAGTRRRIGRLQGHRLRARGSAHQKGSPQAASQQSPLFGSVA